MSTADLLSSQREEINRCVQRRERLLQTLFGVTQSFLRITGSSSNATDTKSQEQDLSLSGFLDANDLSQNRFFDQNTLPLPQHSRQPYLKQRRQNEFDENKQSHESHPSPHFARNRLQTRQRSLSPEDDGRSGQVPAGERSVEEISSVLSQDGSSRDSKSATTDGLREHAEVNKLASKTKQNDGSGSKHLPTHRVSEFPGTVDNGGDTGDEHTSNLTPPHSGRFAHEGDDQKDPGARSRRAPIGGDDSESASLPNDSTTKTRSFSSPRLQEPGKDSQREAVDTNAADLPSRFMQDTFDGDQTIMDISPLHDEAGRSQYGSPLVDQSLREQRPSSGLRNATISGLEGDAHQDPTISRRPPMRIDTVAASQARSSAVATGKPATTASEAATPNKATTVASTPHSPPERTTTRLSSGALQHRSVSEILGETPRTASSSKRIGNESARSDQTHLQSPITSSPTTPKDMSVFRNRLSEMKDKERSKLSTVIFAKPQHSSGPRSSDAHPGVLSEAEQRVLEPRDYFLTFFAAQIYQAPRASPMTTLIRQANKTIGTPDHFLEIREKQDFKVLNYIKEMQHSDRWSLRQRKRAPEPQRPASHWDVLLGQMKWMRTDFREERKFKIAGARHLADACAAWISATEEDRRKLEVKVRRLPRRASQDASSHLPDLVHDETSDLTEDEIPIIDPMVNNPPAAIFSLPPDQFVFGLNSSPVAEKILLELPCYQPAKDVQNSVLHITDVDPDSTWKTPLVHVSKYAKGKLISMEEGPPRKKARLEVSDSAPVNISLEVESGITLSPATEDVALFNPENRHVRDRIHAGHAFRPPSEYQMPSREFFEWRAPSQWTPAEDDELRKLVREYSYNWSLISNCLTPSTFHASGSERRTPWECFERWIGLEGLPAEMSKVPYFRTYHQRLSQAARTVEARQQASLQSQPGNAAIQPHRRRSNQPCTVEKRKSLRPIHLVDAMRKHAKKKEAALHKQQQQATLGAMRKSNEAPKERKAVPTAREMSRIKYERQMKMEEQNRLLRMQYVANAQHAKKVVQQQGVAQTNGNPSNRNGLSGLPNGNVPSSMSAIPHGRGTMPDSRANPSQVQRAMSGSVNGVPAPGQGLPNVPAQPQMQVPGGQRLPAPLPNDLQVYQAAHRVQAEQQAFLQQQRQHRHPQNNSQLASPNMQNASVANSQTNPAMLASMQGRASPSVNGTPSSGAVNTSPRASQAQPQTLSSGVTPAVSQIQNQVKMQHPSAPPEEIQRLTTQQLVRLSQQQSMNQQALAAAVGNSGTALSPMQAPNPLLQNQQAMYPNGNNSGYNQAQYAAYMRSQQMSQSRAVSSGSATTSVVPNSRSATPNVQRTGSAQGGGPPRGPSQSPRPGPVGVSGSQ